MAQLCTISGGAFQDPSAKPLALGTLVFRLQVDIVLGTNQICAGREVTLNLDSSGNVTGSPTIWGAATYLVRAYAADGQPSWWGTINVPNASSFSLTP